MCTVLEEPDRRFPRQRVKAAFARREELRLKTQKPTAEFESEPETEAESQCEPQSEADAVARACRAMAARFRQGGKLIVFGSGVGSPDPRRVADEFMHPAAIGKRALPAVSLTYEVAAITGVAQRAALSEVFARQVRHLAEPADIALGLCGDGWCEDVRRGLQQASALGLLTVALVSGDGGRIAQSAAVRHVLRANSGDPRDPRAASNGAAMCCSMLCELVHVLLAQPAFLPRSTRSRPYPGGR